MDKQAGILVRDDEANSKLVTAILDLLNDKGKREMMQSNISKLGITNADERIAGEILQTIGQAQKAG